MLRSTLHIMNLKRTATILVAGGVLAAWLSDAMTPAGRAPVVVTIAPARAIDARGADLAKEIARLQDRLRPDAAPSAPARNLFEFKRAPTPVVVAPPADAPAALAPAAPVPLTLDGIAEDANAGGIVRTAIISESGQLFLVKQGEDVPPRYKVARVAADGVDLQDVTDSTIRHLTLK